MTDPSHVSRLDADRILRRAAEIEGSSDAATLSLDELRAIASEAGFARGTIDRALAEVREADRAATVAPVQKWGIIFTHLSTIREVPVGMTADQLNRLVRLFHPYREGAAQVKLEEHEITWRDRKGLRFAITSAHGVTEIRIYVSKLLIRKGRWMGWVKAAADRLEMLALLVARPTGGGASPAPARPELPPPGGSGERTGS